MPTGLLAAEFPVGHADGFRVMGIGVIFGVRSCMKPVTCAIDANVPLEGPAKVPEPLGNSPDDADSSPRRVLVVDDEPLIRWSVSETLSDLGYDVEQAGDARTALRMITTARRPFDVIVLDLRLPDMQDLSLLATLRQLLPGTALILMTAFGTAEIMQGAQALGAAVLNKPFEFDALKHLVNTPGMEAD